MFCVYAVYNQIRDKIYIGHTENLVLRIARHNNLLHNKKTSFTSKNNGDWVLIYHESYETRRQAMIREKEVKSSRGRQFIRQIIKQKIAPIA